jgi:DNA modification methylase
VKPFTKFISAVETVIANCPQKGKGKVGPASKVINGDARSLKVQANSVDLVLTSPPYLNAIDYMRCSKFSLVWMGYTTTQLRDIRSTSVGAEAALDSDEHAEWVERLLRKLRIGKKLSDRDAAILCRYARDMEKALSEAARVLKKGGRAVYVVGNSTIRGTFIKNSTIVEEAAIRHGLNVVSAHTRTLPANRRYLPPPTAKDSKAQLDARMRQEVVLVFKKAA